MVFRAVTSQQFLYFVACVVSMANEKYAQLPFYYGEFGQTHVCQFVEDNTKFVVACRQKAFVFAMSPQPSFNHTIPYPDGVEGVPCLARGGKEVIVADTDFLAYDAISLSSGKRVWGRGFWLSKYRDKQLNCMALCAERQTLARGFTDGKIGLYSFPSNKDINSFQAHRSTVTSICFTPNGHYLVSSSHDAPSWSTVVVTRCSDHAIVQQFQGFDWCVTSICVTPCGRYIVCGSFFRIKCFCLATGHMVCCLKDSGCLYSLCVSPDNRFLGLSRFDGTIKILENPITAYWRRVWARSWLKPHDSHKSNVEELNRFFQIYPGLRQLIGTKILLYSKM